MEYLKDYDKIIANIDLELLREMADQYGYSHLRIVGDDVQCISQFLYTSGILCRVTLQGYGPRYCYHSMTDAVAAFEAWDGVGEPEGWHRATAPGKPTRRREDDGTIVERE